MKILITGANGFLGSHLAEDMISAGHQVSCLVRKTSNLNWLKNLPVKYYYGDVCHPELLNEPVRDAEVIIHAAGIVRAVHSENYFIINRDGTRNLVNAVANHNPKLKKFVYISSQAALGPAPSLAQRDSSGAENPVSDYGKSKLEGEKELLRLPPGVPYTILRPASVYGPRDKDIFIFFSLVNSGFFPKPLKKRFIQLVFVKDISKAALGCVDNPLSNGKSYFLAEERVFSWEDVGRTIAASLSKKALPLPLPDFVFRVVSFLAETYSKINGKAAVLNKQKITEMLQDYWVADSSRAARELGVGFTKLENGAKITFSWYKENHWF
ncbi:MAG TPA: hypothetical protein DEE98_03085 [Elusimicrobia bacterium]|nr:MAG: hypothetical protein A2278_07905 [Elusimicrobia bacterium RIFOXYA12_FULL_49_49]OGS09515.1 MAG: hypothetical protein A2204_06655 [Elusimicrobia bacterium RIFOXYA1_FULL_47_7]OGS11802.1 MAG: hypothetical protein A2386_02175 [Elusimicrobia bacterium RIFOXYB1_FULL_48_9]OGS16011.1 MAG: hypothetical protein A2251_02360 [Elusimicrobia bacterium RIFOXYA2_FULL_47_53]OGS26309.1 MAG: hypothetical protein A2339_02905 [Elusimicrobia bacterium RIFOXYB12_FULL_50_12]OGS29179.1 MAG: hypothetical protein